MKKVMLAANERIDLEKIKYPKLVSGKIDGIRACIQDSTCVSRSLKDSLNRHITECLSKPMFEGFDGELTTQGCGWNDFNHNQSVIMTQSGRPTFTFHVFEHMCFVDKPASMRKDIVKQIVTDLDCDLDIRFVEQHLVHSAEEVLELYTKYRELGYEGLILMDPNAKYKHGRSTLNQEIMLKMKPSEDSEAIIIGMEELMHNLDAGNSKRQENLVPGDMLGKLKVLWNGKTFYIGTGFSEGQRREMWHNSDKYIGKLAKFKFMELSNYGIPRSPVFIGIRHKDDM